MFTYKIKQKEKTKTFEEKDKTFEEKISLALKTTSIETLIELSKDENYHIRTCVAQNHNTPVEILDKLSEDEDWYIRYLIAKHPNSSVETLDKLSQDKKNMLEKKLLKTKTVHLKL